MLENFEIERLVPRFLLQDKNGYALAKAMEALALRGMEIMDEAVAIHSDVEKMPEWRLDEMAQMLNASWYDYAADTETKRAVIRGAKEYYDRLGTPYAIERAISDVYGAGRIEEWFDYGGEPYHFRVFTTNVSALKENRAKFLRLMDIVKNVRSVLDNIYYSGEEGTAAVTTAAAVVSAYGAQEVRARNYGEG
ncbi:MAG: phage tail protein [Clostridia bacterium]|nr:phage tail protein [Clostridia bacterium]